MFAALKTVSGSALLSAVFAGGPGAALHGPARPSELGGSAGTTLAFRAFEDRGDRNRGSGRNDRDERGRENPFTFQNSRVDVDIDIDVDVSDSGVRTFGALDDNARSFGGTGWGESRREYGYGNHRQDRIYEVAPGNLHIDAFQIGDRIIINAHGDNPTTGFTTCLERITRNGRTILVLRNRPAAQGVYCEQTITPFDLAGTIRVRNHVSRLTLLVAGHATTIDVRQVHEVPRVR